MHTFTFLVGTIGEPQNPRCSRRLQNLPPILGGGHSIKNSPTQPYHTLVSATVLGSTLLGSTLLGSNTQGHPSISSPSQAGGGQTFSQEVQPHQIPLKGQVHYLLI